VGGGTGGGTVVTQPPAQGGGATVTTEAVYWHHNDHLGTPQALTDINGTVVWTMSQTPFGIATVNEDPDGDGITVTNNFRFPGQYYDSETGLNYNYFRTYDPTNGGYTQSDPIGLNGGMNSFGYVGGNPINGVDPFGLTALPAAGAALVAFCSRNPAACAATGIAICQSLGLCSVPAIDPPFNPASNKGKQCKKDDSKCDLEFVREMPSYNGRTKACVYRRKGQIFTFPQAVGYACPPIDKKKCMVDTTFIKSPARY